MGRCRVYVRIGDVSCYAGWYGRKTEGKLRPYSTKMVDAIDTEGGKSSLAEALRPILDTAQRAPRREQSLQPCFRSAGVPRQTQRGHRSEHRERRDIDFAKGIKRPLPEP